MTRLSSVQPEDRWIFTEKFSNELPTNSDLEKNSFVPTYKKMEYPQQYVKLVPKTFSQRWSDITNFCSNCCVSTCHIMKTRGAMILLMYFCLLAFTAFTLYFVSWVFRSE